MIEEHVARVHCGLGTVAPPAMGAGGGGRFKTTKVGELPSGDRHDLATHSGRRQWVGHASFARCADDIVPERGNLAAVLPGGARGGAGQPPPGKPAELPQVREAERAHVRFAEAGSQLHGVQVC